LAAPELGALRGLAEWTIGVRPADAMFSRVHGVLFDAEPSEITTETAAAVTAEIRAVSGVSDVAAGAALADELIDRGTQLIVVAVPEMRPDAATAVSVLTGTEPVKVLSRGAAATDPEAWMALAVEVRDRRRQCLAYREDPDRLLVELNSPRLAAAAGLTLQAAARRTPVLLDGPVAATAALIAYEAQPRAVRWWAAADLGPDPAHETVLTRLGLRTVLGLGIGAGDLLAGMLALPVLRAALRLGSRTAASG
jgi:nicotinate-nucleotide--dimethylbenzimidazole phosphoribosyltransferase